jgi:predicted signal transduction protein with EAL and GGDEF domain
MAQSWGLRKEDIILEITEQEAVSNYNVFIKAIEHYRNRGFRIAIDDFGAGYGGLKMLSLIAPDIDIDCFKPYNDKHGYALGDEVIKEVGRLAVKSAKKFRAKDVPGSSIIRDRRGGNWLE